MTTHAAEGRMREYEADQRLPTRVKMWILVGDLVILSLAFASVVIITRAQGTWNFQSVARSSNAPGLNAEPVISAWHSWEETAPPVGGPARDEQGKQNPNVAILTPNGFDVVAQMHQHEPNTKWTATLAVGSQKPS